MVDSDIWLGQQVNLLFADAIFQFSQVSCQTVHILQAQDIILYANKRHKCAVSSKKFSYLMEDRAMLPVFKILPTFSIASCNLITAFQEPPEG